MDRKLILEFAKKDIDELQLLVEALGKNPDPDHILLEITVSRAQTLLRELTLLKNDSGELLDANLNKREYLIPEPQHSILEEKEHEIESMAHEAEPVAAIAQEFEPVAFEEELVEINDEKQSDTKDEIDETVHRETSIITETEIDTSENIIETVIIEETKVEISQNMSEEVEIKRPRLLGENFIKEPSLNERLTGQKEIQSKIKGKPVTSIKAAIGLNDRFMYTRELFDNIPSKFESTVDQLDKATGIIEAIEFLEQNFKWPKSETSLKFVELVKRRFQE